MFRSILQALMVATTLVPAAASAQDDRRGRGGDSRPAQQQQQQQQQRGGGDRQRPATQPSRPAPQQRMVQSRQNRQPARMAVAPVQQFQRPGAGQRFAVPQNRGDNRQGYRGDDRRPGIQQPNRQAQEWAARTNADRQRRAGAVSNRNDYGRIDDSRDRYRNRDRYDDRGGYRDRYSDRGDWNRGWRNDDRYNWNRYRQGNRNAFRLPRYYAPYGWNYGYRRFSIGVSLTSVLFGQDYWIADPWEYRLPPVDGPYRWVRYYNDALLVDLETGQVVDTVYDIFW